MAVRRQPYQPAEEVTAVTAGGSVIQTISVNTPIKSFYALSPRPLGRAVI
jgi:hypothetical protein